MKCWGRVAILLFTCAALSFLNYVFVLRLPSSTDVNTVQVEVATQTQQAAKFNNESIVHLPRCPLPTFNITRLREQIPNEDVMNGILYDWKYYTDLPFENLDTAIRMRHHTSDPIPVEEGNIPHRLIFTHRRNLFSCEDSVASAQLFNLAENAKATVNAYAKIWHDLEYVFLTDDDCIKTVEEVKPELVKWLKSPMFKGRLQKMVFTSFLKILSEFRFLIQECSKLTYAALRIFIFTEGITLMSICLVSPYPD